MKKLAIAAVMLLSGCAYQGDVVNANEIGKARIAADRQVHNGSFDFKSGTGLIYKRDNNQCGNNCAKYAQREIEYKREQAAKHDEIIAKLEAETKRQNDLDTVNQISQVCMSYINMQINIMRAEAYQAAETGSPKANEYRDMYQRSAQNRLSYINKCVAKEKARQGIN